MFFVDAVIEEEFKACGGFNLEMESAFGAAVDALVQILFPNDFRTGIALKPKAFRADGFFVVCCRY